MKILIVPYLFRDELGFLVDDDNIAIINVIIILLMMTINNINQC